ncbi:thioredoxin family protein [Carboxylicivirga linearis]|uniref:Thioredoxin family protein n=1 Tax=Carboxylicivirga linearis TaxID=1628157 RepID=A0ABS5K356_9BACT|nr:thioredoxin family protein [Carboxylicivirga linearis]MBS2101034.1 thioredoxin family protein [Carboxylicivirga linearis]
MYKQIIITVLLFISFTTLAQDGIQFYNENNVAEAVEKANNQDKLLFIVCCAQWCRPCKELTKDYFPLKEFGDFYNPRFINVYLDMDTPMGQRFKKAYNVGLYPTMFFINSNGDIVHTFTDYDLIKQAKEALQNKMTGYKRTTPFPSLKEQDGFLIEIDPPVDTIPSLPIIINTAISL